MENLICLLLVLLTIYVSVGAYRERKEGIPLFVMGWKPVLILSDSMEPTIPTGSIVLIRERSPDSIPAPGDIIMFQLKTKNGPVYVTHRLMECTEAGWITKGDHNSVQDPEPIQPSDWMGTVKTVLYRR